MFWVWLMNMPTILSSVRLKNVLSQFTILDRTSYTGKNPAFMSNGDAKVALLPLGNAQIPIKNHNGGMTNKVIRSISL